MMTSLRPKIERMLLGGATSFLILKPRGPRYIYAMPSRVLKAYKKRKAGFDGRHTQVRVQATATEHFFSSSTAMPEVLLVEGLAQTTLLGTYALKEDKYVKDVLLTGIEHCTFKQRVVPGDTLTLKVDFQKRRGPFFSCYGQIFKEEELIVECRFFFPHGFGFSGFRSIG